MFGGRSGDKDTGRPVSSFISEPWYMEVQKLNNEELMRVCILISDGHYRFAKNAWYMPIGMDQRCPIMVAKGFRSPDTLDRMAAFENIARTLEVEYRHFIDAWDFGYITEKDIERGILKILESRNIAIAENF